MRVFQAVDASGYARIDLLMDRKTGKMYVNEINTIPGFTSISMFPSSGRPPASTTTTSLRAWSSSA